MAYIYYVSVFKYMHARMIHSLTAYFFSVTENITTKAVLTTVKYYQI